MNNRKDDHLFLAARAQVLAALQDRRFIYEPMLSAHPDQQSLEMDFLGKRLGAPLWISSMTGGGKEGGRINRILAQVARRYRLGLGMGSCRVLLENEKHWSHFELREYLGPELPLFANLGIGQVEQLLSQNKIEQLTKLVDRLQVDGLIVHVNPLQEWLQPEGDRFKIAPIETLSQLLQEVSFKVIVKEVGQGMGPASLLSLLKLPLAAVELAGFGGTNFSLLEINRSASSDGNLLKPLVRVGHTALEMIEEINSLLERSTEVRCRDFIISGGVRSFLDGYYLRQQLRATSVYGQAGALLAWASKGEGQLEQFVAGQIEGLKLAQAYLRIRKD